MLSKISILLLLGKSFSFVTADDPYTDFLARVDHFALETISRNNCDIFTDLLRLHFEDTRFCPQSIYDTIDRINGHRDGIDFNLASIGWILHHYWDSPLLDQDMRTAIVEAVTNITLWYGDSGYLDNMQYWSENHQSGWNSAEYLIGAGFAGNPDLADVVFKPTGLLGRDHEQRGREKVVNWLKHRMEFGFSEFNSDTYGQFSFRGAMSVVGSSPEDEVVAMANQVINLQMYDWILAAKNTKLVSPRGRAYADSKLSNDGGYSVLKIITGQGDEDSWGYGSGDGVYFTLAVLLGRYTLPTVLLDVYQSIATEDLLLEERFGLGEYEGIGPDGFDPVNCTFWFGNGGYFSPVYPRCIFIVGDAYSLWDRQEIWQQVKPAKPLWDLDPFLVDTVGEIGAPLGHGAVLGPANMRIFRTPDVLLGSLQDYKGGFMAGQQHAWQAALDTYRYGNVYTVQPTNFEGQRYWEGGVLPKIGQFGATLIAVYSPEVLNTLAFGVNMTHAHVRLDQFDEIYTHWLTDGTDGNWRIMRQGDAYLALFSLQRTFFREDLDESGEFIVRDLVAPGEQNVWICEVGSKALNGSFADFERNIINSEISVSINYDNSLAECLLDNHCFDGIFEFIDCMIGICAEGVVKKSDVTVSYSRAGLSFMFDWYEGMTVNGAPVQLSDFKRYNNKFTVMDWTANNISVTSDTHYLNMNFETFEIEQN